MDSTKERGIESVLILGLSIDPIHTDPTLRIVPTDLYTFDRYRGMLMDSR